MNTFYALTASTVVSFWLSFIIKGGKLSLDHVLNSTLAGGVIISGCADLFQYPYPSLLAGAIAGALSVISFTYFNRLLEM